jgi:hypothetical protein
MDEPAQASTFSPEAAHVSVALVMSGVFSQLADPLDLLAQAFGVNTKVDREQLAESLACTGGMGLPQAEARGLNRTTRFRVEVVGKCESRMVAQCRMTFDKKTMTKRTLEENALALTMRHEQIVLGVQATRGLQEGMLDGLVRPKEETYLRIFPMNVFNRAFFREQIAVMSRDRNLKLLDAGQVVGVELGKPWLFYDMPAPSQANLAGNLLPFARKS